jgi:hypothetical protein
MNSTSPPMPVTASPVAMPGVSVRSATSEVNRDRPRYIPRFNGDGQRYLATIGSGRDLPQQLADLALEAAHPRLAGVAPPMIARKASSVSWTSAGSRPFRASCRPTRWSRAMRSSSWTVQPSNWTISMPSSRGARIVSTTFAVGSSYPPIVMRRVPKWSRADDPFEPCACALQRTGVELGHVTEQRRVAGARSRRAAYAGSSASRMSFSWVAPFSSSRCASAACSMGSCRSRRMRRVPLARSRMV